MKKKICPILALFLCSLTFAYGYSLTLIVTQNDKTQSEIRLTTRAVEDCILNSFFDVGVIVSNEPILADAADMSEFSREIRLAAEGGFDYILHLTIQYKKQASSNPAGMLPGDIQEFQWEIYRSSDIKKIAKGTFKPPANLVNVTGKRESDQAVKKICNEISMDISTAIAETGRSK